MNQFTVPKKIYFEKNSLQYLVKMENVARVFLVTCHLAVKNGFVDIVRMELAKRKNDVKIEVFVLEKGAEEEGLSQAEKIAEQFESDTVIGLGCSRVMRFAKEVSSSLATSLALIPITSGSGEEVQVAKDGKTLSDVVIVDGQFVMGNSKEKTATTGLIVLGNAIGSYLSERANDYTRGFSLQAIKIVLETLEKSVQLGDFKSREKMHNAATTAGIAVNNTGFKGNLSEVVQTFAKNKEKVKEIEQYVGLTGSLEGAIQALQVKIS